MLMHRLEVSHPKTGYRTPDLQSGTAICPYGTALFGGVLPEMECQHCERAPIASSAHKRVEFTRQRPQHSRRPGEPLLCQRVRHREPQPA